MLTPYRIVNSNKKYFRRAFIRTIMLFRPCYSTLEKQSLVITVSPILFSVAIGLQAVGNSKTAPAGPFDYMDLMFEKQDEM